MKHAVSYAATTRTIIAHYAACLRRQCQLEEEYFDGENQLRKQYALPMFKMGQRQSIMIDKKGFYYVILQYQKELLMADQPLPSIVLPPGGTNSFTYDDVRKWMHELFRIGKNGYFAEHPTLPGKNFKDWSGIQLTTDGVKASLHYMKVDVPREGQTLVDITTKDGVNEELKADFVINKGDEDEQNYRVLYIGPNGKPMLISELVTIYLSDQEIINTLIQD